MSNLVVKEVRFNDDVLMAAQDKESEKVYVAVKWVSEGIGLSLGQFQSQTRKIQEDLALSQGIANLQLPTKGGKQEVLCIELDFLPLWLAKISITPKMKKDNPFMVQKLVDYQLKAKDVLAEAFINKEERSVSNELQFLQGLLDGMKANELKMKELEEQQKQHSNKVVQIQNHLTESPDRKTIQREINTYARRNEMKIQDVRTMIYNKIEDLHGIDIMQRVTNARKKLQDERVKDGKKPYAKSTLEQKINGMDIIAELDLMSEVMKILAGIQ